MRFANWWFLLLIPCIIYLFYFTTKRKGLKFSSIKLLQSAGRALTVKHKIGKALIVGGLILSLVALARPQNDEKADIITRQGIDIAMLLDISGTMQSVDFKPNRLEVARQTIDNFIEERTEDRVSLIIFAGEAFTRIPLTLDHQVIRDSLAEVTTASINQDGTAIGMAISVGLNRLKKSEAATKIMILVTDGDNNAGAIDPLTASKLAQELGIRIYTIGIGSDSLILPVQTFLGTQYSQYPGGFDEELLQKIASNTGGQYFRAQDPKALEQVFTTINELEKTTFNDENFREYNELAYPFIMIALILITLGIILDKYIFVHIP
ncbi:MAG: VWA domain-containing protein [Firmicutes bacterium]|nr:VWA domain-containing protein [Bacillota bacterium]